MIFYFTGTGNSYAAASKIASKLGNERIASYIQKPIFKTVKEQ